MLTLDWKHSNADFSFQSRIHFTLARFGGVRPKLPRISAAGGVAMPTLAISQQRDTVFKGASTFPRMHSRCWQLRWTSRNITFAARPSQQLRNWAQISSDSPEGI